MVSAEDVARGAVEAGRFVVDQPCAGEPREPPKVDVAFLEPVTPGDIAGQHAGIGRLDIASDQRQAHAGRRSHAKALQHMHMGMAAADENEILGDRNGVLHRRPLCPSVHRRAISAGMFGRACTRRTAQALGGVASVR